MLTHDFFFSILLPRLSSSCSLFFDPRPLIISLSLCCEVVGKARLFASFIIIVRSFNRPHLQSSPEAGIDSAPTPQPVISPLLRPSPGARCRYSSPQTVLYLSSSNADRCRPRGSCVVLLFTPNRQWVPFWSSIRSCSPCIKCPGCH
ncbi:hypothetical protein K505DRAFT_27871 [Melanomma pulvis-pyrius CBS 109.77]|uniref:Uncharacterized protein n=1 Tax=Melanomma pulvis-pyrius CBS 109.77 TaxID=1314802 RepID=A0A6A6XCR3_9PLEO|nr:hypothetical protein K505DRAFT_27871 [Melanomma pulvis-pyrius CBS 109.77]